MPPVIQAIVLGVELAGPGVLSAKVGEAVLEIGLAIAVSARGQPRPPARIVAARPNAARGTISEEGDGRMPP